MKKNYCLNLIVALLLSINAIAQSFGDNTLWSSLNNFNDQTWSNVFDAHDFNGDGLLDVVFGGWDFDNSEYHIYMQFNPPAIPVLIGTITEGVAVDFNSENFFFNAADPDGDGDVDYLTLNTIDQITYLYWFENIGNGLFAAGEVLYDFPSSVISVRLADVNQDGYSDIHVDHQDGWSVCAGTATGAFSAPASIPYTCPPAAVLFGDLDADGFTDFVDLHDYSYITVSKGTGNGAYVANNTLILDGLIDYAVNRKMLLADVDGDADLDIILNESSDIRWCENQGNAFFGTYDGSAPQPVFHDIISTDFFLQADVFDVFDIDGDGDLDILGDAMTGFESEEQILWFENNGTGVFLTHVIGNVVETQRGLCRDVNADGLMDLMLFGSDGGVYSKTNLMNVGCTDVNACNYDDVFTIDDGSCCYGECGCLLTDDNATCDDGSCLFEQTGFVFHDLNNNGAWDSGENPLGNQTVMIYPDNILATTNQEGAFVINVPEGYYQISVLTNDVFPICTTSNDLETSMNSFTDVFYFGLGEALPVNSISVQMQSNTYGYPCDTMVYHTVCVTNVGYSVVDVVVMLALDELYQEYELFSPSDSVVNDIIYFSINGLASGQSHCFYMNLRTPNVDYIGSFLTSNCSAIAYEVGNVVAVGETNFSKELTCAYDPNDKLVEPMGYGNEHFIFDDADVQFMVRFQNTGNAPATHVVVLDTIDTRFDFSTFELQSHSHDISLAVYPESRTVAFQFYNIMLPDSFANEPASHGFFTFSLRIRDQLQPLEELYNTAFIYFDNNPPIVTNTTLHTIFDCSLVNTEISVNSDTLNASAGLVYQWYFDDEPINGATESFLVTTQMGSYYAQVIHPLGCLLYTDTIVTSSIEKVGNEPPLFTVSPNPMNTSCLLSSRLGAHINEVQITGITGEILLKYSSIEANELVIDGESLASGLYFIRVFDRVNSKAQTLKLLVN
jgi:hypothetical protein